MRIWGLALLAMAATTGASGVGAAPAPLNAEHLKKPYWASIAPGQALMRSGPGRNYPGVWMYQRSGLPVQVIEVVTGWRKVRDPDGVEGWMVKNLLSDNRTGMVKGGVTELREAPHADARVLWRAEPGVVGRISRCEEGWCRIDVKGRGGFLPIDHLWGVDAGETVG